MKNYLSVRYNIKKKPLSNYPKKFIKYNINRFQLKNKKLLEIGCGRGDFINEFSNQDVDCYATDISKESKQFLNDKVQFSLNDISKDKLPFEDGFFDAIYSKSLIEHIDNHQFFFNECKRVLKETGKIIIYTPDWETQYLHFYDDLTHVKPFTRISLEDSFKIYGFQNYNVEKFYQIPIVWKFPLIKLFLKIISVFVPIRCDIKFLRFSKELMLLGFASKN